MFKKRLVSVGAMLAIMTGIALAQDKKVIVNPDGTYTVIEYPVGKEVVVNLTPGIRQEWSPI